MADTQITAYSDQHYFTRPEKSSYSAPYRCERNFSGIFTCLKYTNLHFFHRSNPTYPVVFSTANFSLIQGYYDASKPTVIVIHGYLASEDSSYIRNTTGVYLTKVSVARFFYGVTFHEKFKTEQFS